MRRAHVKVSVFRKAEGSTEHQYVTYQVPYQECMTVLDCLIWIYENIDPTQALRYSCGESREAACGLCTVRVNRAPVLACKTMVTQPDIVIEPIRTHDAITDLLVPKYPEKDFSALQREIIHRDLCTACGACVSACTTFALRMADETPTLVGACNLCEACYSSCPAIEMDLREAGRAGEIEGRRQPNTIVAALNSYQCAFQARARDQRILSVAQDGGVATALAVYALQQDLVDCAIVMQNDPDDPLRATPVIVEQPYDALKGAGSRYTPGSTASALLNLAERYAGRRVMVVALPCEVQGLRKVNGARRGNTLEYIVGLFCSSIFTYDGLINRHLRQDKRVDLQGTEKIIIKGNRYWVTTASGDILAAPESLKELRPYRRPACDACIDYAADLADISIGAIGANRPGWGVVLIRNAKALDLFRGAVDAGLLTAEPLDEEGPHFAELTRIATRKRHRHPRGQAFLDLL
jgi:coenzyme F420 hydrogenase subunit beta